MIERYKTGPLDNNVYVICDDVAHTCLVIDPGIECEHILETLSSSERRITAVVNTHGHFDHVAGNSLVLDRVDVPLYRHPLDEEMSLRADEIALNFGLIVRPSPPRSHDLQEGTTLTYGPYRFDVWHVPGHSAGSVVLYTPGIAIVGDVLFRGSIGRTDFPGCSMPQLLAGIREKLLFLPDDTRVLPGHGAETTIGRERAKNPYLIQMQAEP